jgi:hypothetical protein
MKTMNIYLVLALAIFVYACSDSDTGNSSGGDWTVVGTDSGPSADGGNHPGDGVTPPVDGATPPADSVTDPPDDDTTPAGCDDCVAPMTCVDGYCVSPEPGGCTPGDAGPCTNDAVASICDDTGTAYVPTACPANQGCVDGACVPIICEPGTFVCEGLAMKKSCNGDGTGFEPPVGCPEGMYCTSGKCSSSCAIDPKFGSYVGCAYWTVDLPNYPDPTITPTPEDLPHAVVISNPGELPAEISFEAPAGIVVDNPDPIVPGNSSRVFIMPVTNVQETSTGFHGIRFTSTRPILAHQFNPWDNQFSNDASLLLPEPFLGSDYTILTWPTAPLSLTAGFFPDFFPGGLIPPDQNGYFTVIAAYDNTTVTFQVTADVKAGGKVSAMKAGGLQSLVLDFGEVLNVEASPESMTDPVDLSGSTVSADKPIAVFAGHEEAAIDGCCADHLEEQMLPPSILGDHYLAVKTKPRGGEVDYWRIQAIDPGVSIVTDPPITGAHGKTLQARGDWLQVATDQSFEIAATGKIQVGQYLVSQESTDQVTGDPSLILTVPIERYRDFYVVMVPDGYNADWVTVVRPAGVAVSADGSAIADGDFMPFVTGWEYAYVALEPGIHKFDGDEPFGLVAYGYNNAVSYGYPGGMSDPSE